MGNATPSSDGLTQGMRDERELRDKPLGALAKVYGCLWRDTVPITVIGSAARAIALDSLSAAERRAGVRWANETFGEISEAEVRRIQIEERPQFLATDDGEFNGNAPDESDEGLRETEPVMWQTRLRPTWDAASPWSPWTECTKAHAEACAVRPISGDWETEARALVPVTLCSSATPVPALVPAAGGVDAVREALGRWKNGYGFNEVSDADVDLSEHVDVELAALASPAPSETGEVSHARCNAPGWEYETTTGPRKAWRDADVPPPGEGWEPNVEVGHNGWERFEYHEESYWRRPLSSAPSQGGKHG